MTLTAPDLTAAPPTLIFPGLDSGPPPAWAALWAGADPGVVLVRHDDPHHALPAIREFETAHLILANPGAVVVGEGLGATVLLRLFATWPHLPVAGALLIDPLDPAQHPHLQAFGALPDTALPVPAILYIGGKATSRDRALARRWDCLLAEAGDADTVPLADTAGETHLPRLRSLCAQLSRSRRTPVSENAAPTPVEDTAAPDQLPPPATQPRQGGHRPLPLPRILF